MDLVIISMVFGVVVAKITWDCTDWLFSCPKADTLSGEQPALAAS